MEILELNLIAFGPFTDRLLKFSQGPGGFHIIHGPNEAGKSSALRGLKALLYGIDERTHDKFIHTKDNLRIGGRLRAQDGQELDFVRRKGRKNTLSSSDGKTLNDGVLAPFLQGATAELFAMLLGIDHDALVQGGQEILEQKGEVGQVLFSASLGSHALHGVLAQLDSEADELFKPKGSAPLINVAIKKHAELAKEIKHCSLSSREWDDRRRALATTSREMAEVQAQLAEDRAEINRLKRFQRCLPLLAKRQSINSQLEALSDVVILPDDFSGRHRQAGVALDKSQSIANNAKDRGEKLRENIDGLDIREDVISAREEIESLRDQVGAHRKALRDRPGLEAERQQHEADIANILKHVRPDISPSELESLRPALSKQVRITTLGTQYPELESRVKATADNLHKTENKLKATRNELA